MMRRVRERRQAGLLDRYWARLVNRRSNDAQGPADGIDPAVAAVAERLAAERPHLDPTTTSIDRLWNRLEASTAVRADNPRAWSGPTIGQNSNHSARRRAMRETEEQPLSSASTDQPASLEERRWATELWKIAAAIIAFAIIGGLLVLVLRDTGDKAPSVVAPGPTSTAVSSPTSNGTATINPTRQAAIAQLTATAGVQATEDLATAVEATASAVANATVNAGLPSPGDVVATIQAGSGPSGLAVANGSLWVANRDDGTVSRIDPATNAVIATIPIGPKGGSHGSPVFVAANGDQVWVTNEAEESIVRIDPATNQVVQTIPLVTATGTSTFEPSGMWVDDNGVWVTAQDPGWLVHIDADSGAVLAVIDMAGPLKIASGFGSIWVVSEYGRSIVRVDPTSNQIIAEIPIDASRPLYVTTGDGSVWASDFDSGTIFRIDPTTNTVISTFDTGLESTYFILVAQSGVWVSANNAYGVVRIDPTTSDHSQVIDMDDGVSWDMAELDGSIWVAHWFNDNIVVRIDPIP